MEIYNNQSKTHFLFWKMWLIVWFHGWMSHMRPSWHHHSSNIRSRHCRSSPWFDASCQALWRQAWRRMALRTHPLFADIESSTQLSTSEMFSKYELSPSWHHHSSNIWSRHCRSSPWFDAMCRALWRQAWSLESFQENTLSIIGLLCQGDAFISHYRIGKYYFPPVEGTK